MIEQINIIVAVVLTVVSILHFGLLFGKEGTSMLTGLKGDNKRWDPPEVIIVVGLHLAILAFLSELIVPILIDDYKLPVWITGSINLILITGLGGKAIINKQTDKPNDKNG